MCSIAVSMEATLCSSAKVGKSLHTPVEEESCPCALDDSVSDCSTAIGTQQRDDASSDCSSDGSAVPVESLLIFDWDDTLFPTSWLQAQGLMEDGAQPDEEQWTNLQQLAGRVHKTLEMATQVGHVVIVTNAQQDWVQLSCSAFMGSLADLLQNVDVVSARSAYEHCSQDPSEWKRLAFEQEVVFLYGPIADGQKRNIVSFGDSMHEQRALVSVTKGVQDCCGKSMKFIDGPSVEQLIEEHDFVNKVFLDVLEHNGDLDVEIGTDNSEYVEDGAVRCA